MKPVLVVLGGSTPFTAALIEALRARAAALPVCELRLFGTEATALERMRRYTALRLGGLGWSATVAAALDEALDGGAVVVNQIRFGGLEARANDEALAGAWQVPADETLGPCGLAAALRAAAPVRKLTAELGKRCPGAWVLNLCNPLSVTTALMAAAGAPAKCVGLCELPLGTVLEVCRVLRCARDQVEWGYAGLNHRGLVFSFRYRGEELMPHLAELLGEDDIFGITAAEIRRIGALPLKYFALTRSRAPAVRRAGFLIDLKDELNQEIDAGQAPPPSLRKRNFDWYSGAVVPALVAIFSDVPHSLVVNVPGLHGLVRETAAVVSRQGVEPRATVAPAHVEKWLRPWQDHERAVLQAVAEPSLASIERAVELDPIVPHDRARHVAREIWKNHEHRA